MNADGVNEVVIRRMTELIERAETSKTHNTTEQYVPEMMKFIDEIVLYIDGVYDFVLQSSLSKTSTLHCFDLIKMSLDPIANSYLGHTQPSLNHAVNRSEFVLSDLELRVNYLFEEASNEFKSQFIDLLTASTEFIRKLKTIHLEHVVEKPKPEPKSKSKDSSE